MAPVPDMQGFVPNPSGRGTFDILWSCITTLVLCSWTSLHINLPTALESSFLDNLISVKDRDHTLRFKVGWMVVMLLVPEWVLVEAFLGWCEAYQAVRRISREEKQLDKDEKWTMVDGFFVKMGGLTHNGNLVDVDKIIQLIKDKEIPPQPSRSDEIRDKSKSDALGKGLTCAQALWLAIQCLARAIQHLPISTLELGTVGYVFIAIAINGIYWHKPKDILTPLEVLSWDARGLSRIGEDSSAHPDAPSSDVEGNVEEKKSLLVARKIPTRWQIWLDRIIMHEGKEDGVAMSDVIFVLVCALYGGWHCLAWNFSFPSVTEKWLWRITSILTALPGLVMAMAGIVTLVLLHTGDRPFAGFVFLAFVLYFISRSFILVEMFIGLRRLPAGIFDTVRWTSLLPHV